MNKADFTKMKWRKKMKKNIKRVMGILLAATMSISLQLVQQGRRAGYPAAQRPVLQTYTRRRGVPPLFPLCHPRGPSAGSADPFRHPIIRTHESRPSFGHEGHDRLQPEPHPAPAGRAGTYRQGECVSGGGMLITMRDKNLLSRDKATGRIYKKKRSRY